MPIVPLRICVIPDEATAQFLTRPWRRLGNTLAVEIRRAPLDDVEKVLKRTFDVVVALFGLIVALPLLVCCAAAIRLESPGPVVFRQTRHGFNGRPFRIYKFRTMSVVEDGPKVVQATRRDRRITRVGAWLRRSSIDELPQLLNVLRGDMSMVGPRPHAAAHNDYYMSLIDDYALRSHVKPGLTGWAQINGFRGKTNTIKSMAKRVQLDIWYINNWSLWLDALTVIRTVFEVIRARNAY